MRVDEADRDARIPGERRMHRVVRQDFAQDAIRRVGRDGPDGVAGVDQLDVGLGDPFFQLGLEPGTDVGEDRVARGIVLDVDGAS